MSSSHVTITATGEVFTHKLLWSTCQRQLAAARSDARSQWHFYLAAMTMGYMTFEAYLNYVGAKLLPELWADERRAFGKPPYQGTSGKLKKLCEHVGTPLPDPGVRPYQSVVELKKLRDFIAHGKLEAFQITETHPQNNIPSMIRYSLDEQVTPEIAERVLSDLQVQINQLHSVFLSFASHDLLLPSALDGITAMSSWSANEP